MRENRLKFGRQILLGLATVLLVAEAGRTLIRKTAANVPYEIRNSHSTRHDADVEKIVAEFPIRPEESGSAVLVLGNIGPSFDGEVDVTISVVPESGKSPRPLNVPLRELKNGCVANSRLIPATRQIHEPFAHRRDSGPSLEPEGLEQSCSSSDANKDGRIYFLPTARLPSGKESPHTPIQCGLMRQNQLVRIYVDQKVRVTDELSRLIQAVDDASASGMVGMIEALVGVVDDIDGDGRLAIVLTPAVERLGTGKDAVKGLTRSSDFARGLDRPASNQSDAVFLSSNLNPGEELNAVLAHEWCHAAVFSRRMIATELYGQRPSDDDWLNEAIAHIVEVRASGSWTNLSHRIQSFLTRPESSPLIVRDYYHSEFWRHDGCRGAAFLFLQWCINQAEDSLLDRLLDSPGCTVESLEEATGRSFSDLFLGWTQSLGREVALQISSRAEESKCDTPAVHLLPWRITDGAESCKVHISGGCAAFIRIDVGPAISNGYIRVSALRPDQIQSSLIPIAAVKR